LVDIAASEELAASILEVKMLVFVENFNTILLKDSGI
jgi:hypothetical protein